jgi:hypothetical protein
MAVYLERREPLTATVLLLLHFAMVWTVLFDGTGGVPAGVWAPALFGMIVYFAFKARFEAAASALMGWGGRDSAVAAVSESSG